MMFRYLFLYFIKIKWFAESFNINAEDNAEKFKCYYDQKNIPDSKRIEIWREFKYPSQCQEWTSNYKCRLVFLRSNHHSD